MTLPEAIAAADKAAHRAARQVRALRPTAGGPAPTRQQAAQLVAWSHQLSAAAIEIESRVRGVAEQTQG